MQTNHNRKLKNDMNKHQELIISALQNMKGDDSYRAQLAFRGQDLDAQHGESGKTRRQILNGYLEHDAKVNEAILWVKGVATT